MVPNCSRLKQAEAPVGSAPVMKVLAGVSGRSRNSRQARNPVPPQRTRRRFAVAGMALATACSSAEVGGLPVTERAESVKALMTPTGVVATVLGGGPGAWEVRTPCGGTATVKRGEPITASTVVLVPGHGDGETGASRGGIAEKDVNLAVAEYAKQALQAQGTTVVLTRTGDYGMTVAARAALATALQPAALVSIHHNGGPYGHSSEPGTETYYKRASPDSRRLAGLLYEETVAHFRGHRDVTWHANANPGAKHQLNPQGDDYFGILRLSTKVPAVLSEGLFLSSSEIGGQAPRPAGRPAWRRRGDRPGRPPLSPHRRARLWLRGLGAPTARRRGRWGQRRLRRAAARVAPAATRLPAGVRSSSGPVLSCRWRWPVFGVDHPYRQPTASAVRASHGSSAAASGGRDHRRPAGIA